MQTSFSFHADLSEQRIVSQDKVECNVAALDVARLTLLESHSATRAQTV